MKHPALVFVGMMVFFGSISILVFSPSPHSDRSGLNRHRTEKEDKNFERTGAYQALDFWTRARAYPDRDIPQNKYYKAFLAERLKRSTRSVMSTMGTVWNPIGPTNLHGRSLSVALNPLNPNTVYVGTASGGLWRSFSGGLVADWQQIRLGYPALGISAIVIDPSDTNTLFIGTGEVYRDSASDGGLVIRTTRGSYGIGILKSTDAGVTWTKSLDWSLNQQTGIQAIRMNPLNHHTLWAATTEGVYKTTDAGTTWNNVDPVRMVEDLLMYPADTNTVVISHGDFNPASGMDKTTNNGLTWFPSLYHGYTGKTVLDIYDAHPNVIYASASDSTLGSGEIWKSTDFGASWYVVNSTARTLPNFGVQGWYSHYVAVNPADSNQIIHAEVNISKSSNGGQSFSGSVGSYSDHHAFAKYPAVPNLFYEVNDDGVYRSTDFGASFVSVSDGMQTGQLYNGFSSSAQDSLLLLTQSQDHIPGYIYRGSSIWASSATDEVGWTAIDQTNDNIMYAVDRNGSALYKSTDRGNTFPTAVGFNGTGGWNSPFVVSTAHPNVLYFADQYVHKSTTAGASFVTGNGNAVLDGNPALSMAMGRMGVDTVYIGMAPLVTSAHIFRTVDGGATWTNITSSPLPNRYPMDIAVDPNTASVVYAAFGGFGSGHLFKSTDAGSTWTDITGTLPDVPTTAIAIDPFQSNNVYVGNDFGVYVSTDAGSTWSEFNEGLPDAVIAADLVVSPANKTLRIATHGNGVYERKLLGASDPQFFDIRPLSINTPADGSMYLVGSTVSPLSATFRNASTIVSGDSITVQFRIVHGSTEIFSSTKRISPLAAGENRQVTFDGSFTPTDSGALTTEAVALVADSNAADDTLKGTLLVILQPTVSNWRDTKSSCPYLEITGGSPGPFGDDATTHVGLPFLFLYDGYPYDSIQISTNGWLEFGTGTPGTLHGLSTPSQVTAYFVPSLATTAHPTKALGPWWTDLSTGYNGTTGSVTYATTGTAPNREFIVQWKYMLPYYDESVTTMRINFQIHLFESSNEVEFHYGPVVPGSFPSYATGAAIGLKDYVGGDYRYYDLTRHATGLSSQLISNLTPVANWPGQDSCIHVTTNFIGMTLTPYAGWNLMSVPVTPFDYSKQANFPSSVIFEYLGGYHPLASSDSVLPGVGFWVRFDTIPYYRLWGTSLPSVTVGLKQGWNIIGGPDHAVNAPSGGVILSYALGYSTSSGYTLSSVLQPGYGYWLRVSADTTLTLGPSVVAKGTPAELDRYDSFTFRDKLGRGQTLYFNEDPSSNVDADKYSLPPVPPVGMFDVRYGSGRFVETVPSAGIPREGLRIPVNVQAAQGPITVLYKVGGIGEYQLAFEELNRDAGPTVIGVHGEGRTAVDGNPGHQLVLVVTTGSGQVPRDFALRQNYPNPFNPTTRIEYDLPQTAHVTLRVYDLTGREVGVLVDADQEAGSKSVNFDASALSSGMYIYKITAGKFSTARKMLLVK